MNINVQTKSFRLTKSLKVFTKEKLAGALSSFEDRMHAVTIRLSDVNGPRGGNDKRCHVQMVVEGLPDIIVEGTKSNMYAAINNALDRSVRALKKRLKRQRDRLKLDRKSIRHPVAECGRSPA
ncbi:MAG: hypothetical protein A6F70_09640 [Cycloclasticus sp. symbiont of Bathymodiolus heckerae]|nr:MAG: hypothetical protein A6F70_09640 [Cycloclasticus sp. symbiont of Bathymodiolus heckerae]